MGIEYFDGNIYIADTYNHKIKMLNMEIGQVQTILGTGQFGARNSTSLDSEIYEPGDVAFGRGSLFVADTNNHLVRVMDFKTRRVKTLYLFLLILRPEEIHVIPEEELCTHLN